MSDALTADYTQAIQVARLDTAQSHYLLTAALQRSQARIDGGLVLLPSGVVSMAAVLMASNRNLSSLTAIAHAEKLAATPALGDAMVKIQEGVNILCDEDLLKAAMQDGILRSVLRFVLQALIERCRSALMIISAHTTV